MLKLRSNIQAGNFQSLNLSVTLNFMNHDNDNSSIQVACASKAVVETVGYSLYPFSLKRASRYQLGIKLPKIKTTFPCLYCDQVRPCDYVLANEIRGNDICNFQVVLLMVHGQVAQLLLGSHCSRVVFQFLAV